MPLWRHVSYPSVGGGFPFANQLLGDETLENSSGFMDGDTEIRRNGANLLRDGVSTLTSGVYERMVVCTISAPLTIQRAADDGLQSLLVGGILYLADIAFGAV